MKEMIKIAIKIAIINILSIFMKEKESMNTVKREMTEKTTNGTFRDKK